MYQTLGCSTAGAGYGEGEIRSRMCPSQARLSCPALPVSFRLGIVLTGTWTHGCGREASFCRGWMRPGQCFPRRGWGCCHCLVAPRPVTAAQLVLAPSAISTLGESWGLSQRPLLWILKAAESCAFGAAAICAADGAVMDGSPESSSEHPRLPGQHSGVLCGEEQEMWQPGEDSLFILFLSCQKQRRLFRILKEFCGKTFDCVVVREAAVRPVCAVLCREQAGLLQIIPCLC